VPASRPRVLLVEDDEQLRALIAENLATAGFDVTEANDGEAFIDRLVAGESGLEFDVILSDIQMPAFNALDVLVGAHRLIGQTPVVLMTAFGDPHTHESALLRGAAVVLDKPVRMALLCETVTNVLARARPGPPGAATKI
jgi:DNA-binding response OmpR family regulator